MKRPRQAKQLVPLRAGADTMCDSVTGVSWGHGLPLLVSPLPIGKIQLFTFVVDHVPISH